MALVKGLNSYATVEEAEAYFLDRLDVAAWTTASSTQKSQALITATTMLDSLNWTGVAVSSTQSLAFPRSGQYFDPRLGMIVDLENVPSRVINACYELAFHLLNNDGLLDSTGTVDSITVGSIVLTGINQTSKIPMFIKSIIKPLFINGGAKTWWRAN